MAFQEKDYTGLFQHFFSTKDGPTADLAVIADVDRHCQRVFHLLAAAVTRGLLPHSPYFNDQLIAARFHDLGKMPVPPTIYFSPQLTSEQFNQYIEPHPAITLRLLGENFTTQYPLAAQLILFHHGNKYNDRRNGDRKTALPPELYPAVNQLIVCDVFTAGIEPRADHQQPRELREILPRINQALMGGPLPESTFPFEALYQLGLNLIAQS
jgi:hypothetical protein